MTFLVCAKDDGNLIREVIPVVRRMQELGWKIIIALQKGTLAWKGFQNLESEMSRYFVGCEVCVWDPTCPEDFPSVDWSKVSGVLTALSASGVPNVEIAVSKTALEEGKPLFAVEGAPGGRNNPGWDENHTILRKSSLFSCMAIDDRWENEGVVGSLNVQRYHDLDWKEVAQKARKQLQIREDQPVVWCQLHPNRQSPFALANIGAACKLAGEELGTWPIIIVTRHRREKTQPIYYNAESYRNAFLLLKEVGLTVWDNSPEYDHPEYNSWYSVSGEFRPPALIDDTFALPALCHQQGVVVSGFCSFALMDAPYIGVPSILYLDDAKILWGGLLQKEKKLTTLPLRDRIAGDTAEIAGLLIDLFKPQRRRRHIEYCQKGCLWPSDPVGTIMSVIVRRCS